MRDVKLIQDNTNTWDTDIDIVDGVPIWLDEESQTSDQRAAVSSFMSLGSIPGMTEVGVDWPGFYTQGATLVDVDNQIQQMIQEYVNVDASKGLSTSYTPVYSKNKNGIYNITIVKGVSA